MQKDVEVDVLLPMKIYLSYNSSETTLRKEIVKHLNKYRLPNEYVLRSCIETKKED